MLLLLLLPLLLLLLRQSVISIPFIPYTVFHTTVR